MTHISQQWQEKKPLTQRNVEQKQAIMVDCPADGQLGRESEGGSTDRRENRHKSCKYIFINSPHCVKILNMCFSGSKQTATTCTSHVDTLLT